MQIRPATADDIPNVLPMVRRICDLHQKWDQARYGCKTSAADRHRSWLTAQAADPRSVFLVAQGDQELVALLIGAVETEIPIYTLNEYGLIYDLWVQDRYRHEGLARQMTMLALEKFAAMGIQQVRLHTAAPNDAARALFAACGFRTSSIEMLIELNPTT